MAKIIIASHVCAMELRSAAKLTLRAQCGKSRLCPLCINKINDTNFMGSIG
jgi:hypothetical protein